MAKTTLQSEQISLPAYHPHPRRPRCRSDISHPTIVTSALREPNTYIGSGAPKQQFKFYNGIQDIYAVSFSRSFGCYCHRFNLSVCIVFSYGHQQASVQGKHVIHKMTVQFSLCRILAKWLLQLGKQTNSFTHSLPPQLFKIEVYLYNIEWDLNMLHQLDIKQSTRPGQFVHSFIAL